MGGPGVSGTARLAEFAGSLLPSVERWRLDDDRHDGRCDRTVIDAACLSASALDRTKRCRVRSRDAPHRGDVC